MKIYWVLAAVAVILCCIFVSIGKKAWVISEGKVYDRDSLHIAKSKEITVDEIIDHHFRALGGIYVIKKITHGYEQIKLKQHGKTIDASKWFISGVKSAYFDTTGSYIRRIYYTKTAGICITGRLNYLQRIVKPAGFDTSKHHPEHIYGKNYYSWPDLLIDYKEKGIIVRRIDDLDDPYYCLEINFPDGEYLLLFIDSQTFLVSKSITSLAAFNGYDEIAKYYDFTTSQIGYTYSKRQEIDISLPGDTFKIDSGYHCTISNASYDLFADSILNPPQETIDNYNQNSGLAPFIP